MYKSFLLPVLCLGAASLPVVSANAQKIGDVSKPHVTVISPKKTPKEVKSAKIDTEKFELGGYLGFLSVEDFESRPVQGLSARYHVNQRWSANVLYGKSGDMYAYFEERENLPFVADDQRSFQYLAALASYKLVEGRSFIGSRSKFSSYVYADFGINNVKFADNNELGFSVGMNYKLVFTDWLTGDVAFRNHMVQREFLDQSKLTHNLEVAFGLNALF